MKIAHVALWHYPKYEQCGPVVYVHHLARAQRWYGDEPYVVCASDVQIPYGGEWAAFSEHSEGIEYVHLCNRPLSLGRDPWRPEREMHDPGLLSRLTDLFTARAPDIVHIQNFAGLSFDVVEAARQAGSRVVASLHNYMPLCSRDDLFFADATLCRGPEHASCSRCLGTMLGDDAYTERHSAAIEALNRCDAVLPVSQRVAEIYTEHGVDPALMRVERIGSLAAERLWLELGAERVGRARAGDCGQEVNDAPLRLVFFGAGLPRKGAMVFLQALRRVGNPALLKVEMYNGASDREELRSFLRSCGEPLRSRIDFHGDFRQRDLPAILSNADAAVLTPRWEDNGPQTVFEALAAGLPVLATRIGGIPDVVHDGRNGVLVAEGDVDALARAIERLAADRAQLLALRAGIEPPRRIHEHARTLREIYAQSVGSPTHVPGTVMAGHGDLGPGGLPAPPVHAPTHVLEGWSARWPEDAAALVEALAVAAAFRRHVPRLALTLTGDAASAGPALLAALAQAGVHDSALPDVVIDTAVEAVGQPIDNFPRALAGSLATQLRSAPVRLGYADDYHVAEVLLAVLSAAPQVASVLIAGDRLDGLNVVAQRARLSFWTQHPGVRSVAVRLGFAIREADGPAIDLLVIDGHSLAAIAAAASIQAHRIVVADPPPPAALAAYGLYPAEDAHPNGGLVVKRHVESTT